MMAVSSLLLSVIGFIVGYVVGRDNDDGCGGDGGVF